MQILITGGAGYIGSVLTPYLLDQGYRVTVIDNLSFNQVSLLTSFSHPNFHFIKGDVTNFPLMKEEFQKADVIIPLAAIVGAPACDHNPSLATLINHKAITFLIENTTPEQRILFPNTNSGYGIGKEGIFCTEDSPLRPISLYGKLKVEAEQQLLKSKKAICFRLATVFGLSPRMRLDLLVNDFVFRACHDGFIVLYEDHFKRNYIHIRDVAKAFLFGLQNFEKMRGEAFNVGLSDANLSKKELCEKIQQYVNPLYIHSASIGKDPDQRNYIVSNEKLESLGWSPTVSIDQGIRELIAAYPMLRKSAFRNH